jgi:hypothetical protein
MSAMVDTNAIANTDFFISRSSISQIELPANECQNTRMRECTLQIDRPQEDTLRAYGN